MFGNFADLAVIGEQIKGFIHRVDKELHALHAKIDWIAAHVKALNDAERTCRAEAEQVPHRTSGEH